MNERIPLWEFRPTWWFYDEMQLKDKGGVIANGRLGHFLETKKNNWAVSSAWIIGSSLVDIGSQVG